MRPDFYRNQSESIRHAHREEANQSPFPLSWKTGTRLATALRRRPFSLRKNGNKRRLRAGLSQGL